MNDSVARVWARDRVGRLVHCVRHLDLDDAVGYRSFAEVSKLGPVPLLIPLLLCALGAWAVWRGRMLPAAVATGVLLVFTVLAGLSIGAGYVPAAAALVGAIVANAEGEVRRRTPNER